MMDIKFALPHLSPNPLIVPCICLAPAKTAAQSYYILAWSYEPQNNLKAAINALQQALRLMPADEIYQRRYHQLQHKLTSP